MLSAVALPRLRAELASCDAGHQPGGGMCRMLPAWHASEDNKPACRTRRKQAMHEEVPAGPGFHAAAPEMSLMGEVKAAQAQAAAPRFKDAECRNG